VTLRGWRITKTISGIHSRTLETKQNTSPPLNTPTTCLCCLILKERKAERRREEGRRRRAVIAEGISRPLSILSEETSLRWHKDNRAAVRAHGARSRFCAIALCYAWRWCRSLHATAHTGNGNLEDLTAADQHGCSAVALPLVYAFMRRPGPASSNVSSWTLNILWAGDGRGVGPSRRNPSVHAWDATFALFPFSGCGRPARCRMMPA